MAESTGPDGTTSKLTKLPDFQLADKDCLSKETNQWLDGRGDSQFDFHCATPVHNGYMASLINPTSSTDGADESSMQKDAEEDEDEDDSEDEEDEYEDDDDDDCQDKSQLLKEAKVESGETRKRTPIGMQDQNQDPLKLGERSCQNCRLGRKSGRAKMTISLDDLQQHFEETARHAAQSLGVSLTKLKSNCRQYGIERWPGRKIRSSKNIPKELQRVIDSAQGADSAVRSQADCITTAVTDHIQADAITTVKDSEPQLGSSSAQRPSGSSFPSGNPSSHTEPWPTQDVVTFKVAQGKDRVRFRLSSENLSFSNLREEMQRRVKVAGMTFDLQYLDDDHEWIRLACDADFQECILLMRESTRNFIKLHITYPTSILH